MVKVIDKRPTNPQDSLRRLLNGIKTPASVPHGIKVAGPNDYVSFMDSAGVSHRWDGDAIATYNARLAEAEVAMAEAKAELDDAKAELEAAKERIGAASGDLTAYIEKVEAAQAKADAVQASFESVAGELDAVADAVEAVKARTTTVEGETGRLSGAVDNALAEASAASSLASEAGDKAEAAAADAARVQALAQNAVTSAEEAERKALEAAGIAAGKGKVIYSSTAPTGADAAAGNLWIRSTDNRPHRWSGSAWVAVTDKVATDAAASAAAANTLAAQAKAAADKAQADATAAATAAQDAMRAANQAQDSANGKNTVSYTTGTPAGVGTRVGDTHYQVNAAGTVLRWWRWSGTAWVEQALDGQVISSLDAGKITAGTLDAARIKAGSITADKMLIGIGDNLVPNGNGGAAEGWEAFNRETSPAESNGNPGSFWVQGRKVPRTSRFPIRPGVYRFSVDARTSVPSGARFYAQLAFFRAGVQLTVPYPVNNQLLYPEYRTYTGQVTAPAGADSYEIRIFSMHSNGTVDEAEKCWYTGFELREIRDGSLIVNGSITGEKVNAESVAAAVGSFVKVNAENVGVSGELAANLVRAMTTETKNLVVTESAILQHTTLLGTTVAERLNVTKKLIARDAIVDGTLDVAQLNVTEQMAASIVNAMSVNAKKLVVTEDAIMNQLTVIQNIVTPELVAERINVKNLGAALVTAGALQTDDAANRGVKITSTGINAWDTVGRQTIRLDGTNNLITGQLATGDETVGRIKLFNATHPVNRRPAGFITIHDAGGTAGKQGVIEYNDRQLMLSVKDGTEGGYSQPFRKGLLVTADGATLVGNLTLDGQFKKSPAFRAHSIMFGNIPVGHYKEARQPFTKVNGQRPYSVIQVASSNFANINAVNWTNDNEVVIRLYNNSGFEARDVWADTILLGLER